MNKPRDPFPRGTDPYTRGLADPYQMWQMDEPPVRYTGDNSRFNQFVNRAPVPSNYDPMDPVSVAQFLAKRSDESRQGFKPNPNVAHIEATMTPNAVDPVSGQGMQRGYPVANYQPPFPHNILSPNARTRPVADVKEAAGNVVDFAKQGQDFARHIADRLQAKATGAKIRLGWKADELAKAVHEAFSQWVNPPSPLEQIQKERYGSPAFGAGPRAPRFQQGGAPGRRLRG